MVDPVGVVNCTGPLLRSLPMFGACVAWTCLARAAGI